MNDSTCVVVGSDVLQRGSASATEKAANNNACCASLGRLAKLPAEVFTKVLDLSFGCEDSTSWHQFRQASQGCRAAAVGWAEASCEREISSLYNAAGGFDSRARLAAGRQQRALAGAAARAQGYLSSIVAPNYEELGRQSLQQDEWAKADRCFARGLELSSASVGCRLGAALCTYQLRSLAQASALLGQLDHKIIVFASWPPKDRERLGELCFHAARFYEERGEELPMFTLAAIGAAFSPDLGTNRYGCLLLKYGKWSHFEHVLANNVPRGIKAREELFFRLATSMHLFAYHNPADPVAADTFRWTLARWAQDLEALALEPPVAPQEQAQLADSYLKLHDLAEATNEFGLIEECLQAGHELFRNNVSFLRRRVRWLYARGERTALVAAQKEGILRFPLDHFFADGQLMQKLCDQAPQDADLACHHTFFHARHGSFPRAKKECQAALCLLFGSTAVLTAWPRKQTGHYFLALLGRLIGFDEGHGQGSKNFVERRKQIWGRQFPIAAAPTEPARRANQNARERLKCAAFGSFAFFPTSEQASQTMHDIVAHLPANQALFAHFDTLCNWALAQE